MIEGNHQQTYIRRHNFNTIGYLCNRLNTNNLHNKTAVIINDNVKILLSHGTGGGGGTEGYALNRCSSIYR